MTRCAIEPIGQRYLGKRRSHVLERRRASRVAGRASRESACRARTHRFDRRPTLRRFNRRSQTGRTSSVVITVLRAFARLGEALAVGAIDDDPVRDRRCERVEAPAEQRAAISVRAVADGDECHRRVRATAPPRLCRSPSAALVAIARLTSRSRAAAGAHQRWKALQAELRRRRRTSVTWCRHASSFSTRSRPASPMDARAALDRRADAGLPRRIPSTSFGRTYTAASPAETRVSFRSNATTGTPKDMYSIVLFIVETSFNGLSGSGESPTSAVERTSNTISSGYSPGECHCVAIPSSSARSTSSS